MVIKKAEKSRADDAVQKKNKTSVENQVIIIDDENDDDDDSGSGLQTKTEVKKNKDLVKRKGSCQKDTKKRKKGKNDPGIKDKAYASITIESSSDSECLMKNGELSQVFRKKRKRRLPCEGDGNCDALSQALPREQNFLFRKSGKRKIPDSHGKGDEYIKKRKKKKKKHKSLKFQSEDNEAECKKMAVPKIDTISQDTMLSCRKKRGILVKSNISKKKKILDYLIAMDNKESRDEISGKVTSNPVDQLQEEKQCKKRTLGCKIHQASVSKEETTVIKMKKKKPKKEKPAKTQENNSGVCNENLLKSKSSGTQVFQEDKRDLMPDTKEAGRITKKKSIRTKVASNHLTLLKDKEDASEVVRKKKKVKKCKVIQEFAVRTAEDRCENSGKQRIKKRKNKDRGSLDNCVEEPLLKKRRLKKETKVGEDEIKIVAFKKGNCDEINIDKSRRQALQEEIDRESGKTKVIKEEEESENHFGQWSTASFENSEQKAKFLRLLGGFKKGTSVSAQDPLAQATKLNMALDRSREQKLQRDLQAEFEKAVDRKHRRSIGLGFQPATEKHMQIDKYASRSIKFED